MLTPRQQDQANVERMRRDNLEAANQNSPAVAADYELEEAGGCAPPVYVRNSIVAQDGSVSPISADPSQHWKNHHG